MQDPLRLAGRSLASVGRRGAAGFAVSIVLGLALPQLASTLRPFLPVMIFCFIALGFARADGDHLRQTLARPARLGLALLWATAAPPLLCAALIATLGPFVHPGLVLGMALNAAAPALMGVPAYAALFGFRNGLVISVLFLGLAMAPLIAPPLASLLAGAAVPLDPSMLFWRLLLQVGGASLAAFLLRRWPGTHWLEARRHELNGVNVILYFLFAIAAMDGVIGAAIETPVRVIGYLAVCVALCAANFGVSLLALGRLGGNDAFTLAMATALRNTGLLVAALGAATPPETYLFFALMQAPVYFAPLALAPLARKWRAG